MNRYIKRDLASEVALRAFNSEPWRIPGISVSTRRSTMLILESLVLGEIMNKQLIFTQS
jgi:hypothetical protein